MTKLFIFTAKVASINQSGSLNLFSSKELELEQRALLLKRLAFVIYCSGEDQYQKQMPDIQGTQEALYILKSPHSGELARAHRLGQYA